MQDIHRSALDLSLRLSLLSTYQSPENVLLHLAPPSFPPKMPNLRLLNHRPQTKDVSFTTSTSRTQSMVHNQGRGSSTCNSFKCHVFLIQTNSFPIVPLRNKVPALLLVSCCLWGPLVFRQCGQKAGSTVSG